MEGLGLESRRDLPPEYCRYQDEGCELFPSCLECPSARCVYEEPGGKMQREKKLRNKEMMKLSRAQGKSIQEIAQAFGVTTRTVYRILRRNRRE